MLSIVKYFLIISVFVIGLSGCSLLDKFKSSNNEKVSFLPENFDKEEATNLVAKKSSKPVKVATPIYDADQQKMFVELLSDKSNFSQSLVVNAPLENTKDFKINIVKVLPALELDGKLYHAKLLNNDEYAKSLRANVDTAERYI